MRNSEGVWDQQQPCAHLKNVMLFQLGILHFAKVHTVTAAGCRPDIN
jgi:hypothetical protein